MLQERIRAAGPHAIVASLPIAYIGCKGHGEIIASIEYGAAVLGIKLIMVLGHQNCGAVDAAIAGKAVPGQISSLYRFLRPAVNAAGNDLRAATEANAKIQAQLLRESSPVLAEQIKKGDLKVVAGYFDVEIGRVQLLS